MANWLKKILIGDLIIGSDDSDHAIAAGKEMARRVLVIYPTNHHLFDDELDNIIYDFQNDVTDVDDFNRCLSNLYDWGDCSHRLFIDAFMKPEQV